MVGIFLSLPKTVKIIFVSALGVFYNHAFATVDYIRICSFKKCNFLKY